MIFCRCKLVKQNKKGNAMPYIEKEKVKEIRKNLKKELSEFKLSVTNLHGSTVVVKILKGPLELKDNDNGYETVNRYHYENHYEDQPEWIEVFDKIHEIIYKTAKPKELVYDSDYGSVPTFYINISIGDWDKPYKQT